MSNICESSLFVTNVNLEQDNHDEISSIYSNFKHAPASSDPYTQIIKNSEDIIKEKIIPNIITNSINSTDFGYYKVCVHSDIGGRRAQEDKFIICPKLLWDECHISLFGVFDGTVGDYASETVKSLVVPHLLASPKWDEFEELLTKKYKSKVKLSTSEENMMMKLLAECIDYMFKNSDAELLKLCHADHNNYSSSTAVVAILMQDILGIGHLGDSRICIGKVQNDNIASEFLTVDHKPDQEVEMTRIVSCGGSVEYLHNHNNRPFIRGGDFALRKQRGDQPMQLQYSRAFGGKDLKMYGLSNQPDVSVFKLDSTVKYLILASDGLWDVFSSAKVVEVVHSAIDEKNAAEVLVNLALHEQRLRNQCPDNITAIVVAIDNLK